jgi:hypothetical protein
VPYAGKKARVQHAPVAAGARLNYGLTKVVGVVDDSPLGPCSRIMRDTAAECSATDLCNRCHKHRGDWVTQSLRP